MPILHMLAHRTSAALLTLFLLVVPSSLARQADAPDTLNVQVTAMSGTGLTLADCEDRVKQMAGILGQAGYSAMRPYVSADSRIASWHHHQRNTTVLAFFSTQASNNVLSVVEVPGLVRWNEFFGVQ